MYLFLNRKKIDYFLHNRNIRMVGHSFESTIFYHNEHRIATFLNEKSIQYVNLKLKKYTVLYGRPVIFEFLRTNYYFTVKWERYENGLVVGKIFFDGKVKDMYLIECTSPFYREIAHIDNIDNILNIGQYLFNRK